MKTDLFTDNSPVTVAARSKAWNVFVRLNTGIVGSNPARGMDVCVYSVFVLSCVGSGPATGWSLVQAVLPTVYKYKIKEPHIRGGLGPIWAAAPLKKKTQWTQHASHCYAMGFEGTLNLPDENEFAVIVCASTTPMLSAIHHILSPAAIFLCNLLYEKLVRKTITFANLQSFLS
jgi:hypothetical protein